MKMKNSQWMYMLVLLLGLLMTVSLTACNSSKTGSDTTIDERIETAMQGEVPTLVVSNAQAKPGETVTITATLVNNPGVLGSSMILSYDESVMRLKGVENGEAFDGVLDMTFPKTLKNGCVFLWDGEYIEENQIKDGEILVMEFEILKDVADIASPIILICNEGDTVDNNIEPIDLIVEKGVVTIQNQQ